MNRQDIKKKTLYHVTSQNDIPSIMRSGLRPAIPSDKSIPVIALCTEEDVAVWQLLLGADAVLRIDDSFRDYILERETVICHQYDGYSTIQIRIMVPPDHLKKARLRSGKSLLRAHKVLAAALTREACSWCRILFSTADAETALNDSTELYDETMNSSLEAFLERASRVDFSVLTTEEYKDILEEERKENDITFIEPYGLDPEDDLFTHLPEIKFRTFYPGQMLYNFLKKAYSEELFKKEHPMTTVFCERDCVNQKNGCCIDNCVAIDNDGYCTGYRQA